MSFDGYGQGEGYSYMAGGGDSNYYVAPRTGQSGEMGSFVTPADEASSKGWYSVHDSPDVRRAAKPHYVALYEDEDSSGEDSCVRSLPNFLGSVANMSNAAIGAGVLAFPYAFKLTGIYLGPLLAVFFAIIMWGTLHILTKAASLTKAKSYQDTVLALMGPTAANIINLSMYLYLFGCCVAFLNVIGDQLTPLSAIWWPEESLFDHRNVLMAACVVVVISPLCLLKRIEYLGFTSFLAVISIVYMEGVLIRRMHHAGTVPYEKWIWGSGIFKAIPLICFALQCHLVLIPQYAALRHGTVGKMDWVNVACMAICLAIYIPSGLAGYMQLGDSTPDDVLQAFGNDLDISIGRVCIAATCIFSYPLLQFIARGVIEDLLFRKREPSNLRMVIETVLWLGATLGVAILIPKISTVLGFTGSTTAVVQIFMFPGAMWFTMNRDHFWSGKVVGTIIALFGLIVGVVSTVVLALSLQK